MIISKKSMALSLATVIAFSPMVAKAEYDEPISYMSISAPIADRVMYSEYTEFRGKVEEIQNDEGKFSILVTNSIIEGGLNALKAYIDEDVILLSDKDMNSANKDDIKVGMEVVIFFHKDTIMTMSYPPMLGPDVIIINEKEEYQQVMVSKFDKELLNKEKDLYIHPSEETVIVDIDGNKIGKDDLIDKDLIVFYTVVLESYPAQTTPEKIIVLPVKEDQVVSNVFDLENKFIKEIDGITMIPLRLVAENLGYEVSWNQETKTAELSRGAQWTSITIGKDNYSFAKMHIELGTDPILINSRTYVPLKFVEEILKANIEVIDDISIRILY